MRTPFLSWLPACRDRAAALLVVVGYAVLGCPQAHAQLSPASGAIQLPPPGQNGTIMVSKPGTFYLSQNLVVASPTTDAIQISASNVTIDLNGHTITTLTSSAYNPAVANHGIYVNGQSNVTICNGTINGFFYGVYIAALPNGAYYDDSVSYGHLIEDLSLNHNSDAGVRLEGGDSVVRRCQIAVTGGTTLPGYSSSYGILFLGPGNRAVDCDITQVSGNLPNYAGFDIAFGENARNSFALHDRVSSADFGIYFDETASGKYEKTLLGQNIATPYQGGTGVGYNDSYSNNSTVNAPAATFTFNLGAAYYTSAGVYNSNNDLVRTLWNRVRFVAGSHTATWDGNDDHGNPSAAGSYTVKVLCHNVSYAWDGVIGNTSSTFTGPIHRTAGAADNVADLLYDSNSQCIYEAYGYNEGSYDIRRFNVNHPQVMPQDVIHNGFYTSYGLMAMDESTNILYVANVGNIQDLKYANTYTTFVAAYTIDPSSGTPSPFPFSAGVPEAINPRNTSHYPETLQGCIDAIPNSAPSKAYFDAATGLAVQQGTTRRILAIAHGISTPNSNNGFTSSTGFDKVLFYDKKNGNSLGSIPISNPQRMVFDSNGNLWVAAAATSGANPTTILKFTISDPGGNSSVTCSQTATITSLSKALALAISPAGDTLLVADGDHSQQVKAFSTSTGAPLPAPWPYGQLGGYSYGTTINSQVTNDKFQFGDQVGLTTVGSGSSWSFWIGDGGCTHGGTNRILQVSATPPFTYLAQVASLSSSDTVAVASNDPTRVFWDFLEYHVDYSQPLQPGDPGTTGSWQLVRNWAAGVDLTKFTGPHTIVQLGTAAPSGGLYGLLALQNGLHNYDNTPPNGSMENALFEFTSGGVLRQTPSVFDSNYSTTGAAYSLFGNGDLRYALVDSSGNQTFWLQPLNSNGFDAKNNPSWNAPLKPFATASAALDNPQTGRGNPYSSGWQLPITDSGYMIVFDQSIGATGWHLGAITQSSDHFQWRASPSVSTDIPMDGLGSFDIGDGVNYAGNKVVSFHRNVIYGYNGESWNQSQAGQHMHYYDDGLFIGQFGTSGDITTPLGDAVPGFAGNDFCPAITSDPYDKANAYYYVNDEHEHGGINRWHLSGLGAINELTAAVSLGGSATLQNSTTSTTPADLQAFAGNAQVTLSWSPVTGASSYTVKWSTTKGGPYTSIPNVASPYTLKGLTNEQQPYYFVVTATTGQTESAASHEVHAVPIDVTTPVHLLGSVAFQGLSFQPGPPPSRYTIALNSSAPGSGGFPVQLHPMFSTLGTLYSIDFGAGGYSLFNADGRTDNNPSSVRSNVPAGFSVVPDPTWSNGVGYPPDNHVGYPPNNQSEYVSSVLQINKTLPLYDHYIYTNSAGGAVVAITVPATDTGWHCLTVLSPAQFADSRAFNMTLASHTSPQQARTFSPTAGYANASGTPTGYNYIVQFAFQGSVDLTMIGPQSSGISTILTGVFLDTYPVQ